MTSHKMRQTCLLTAAIMAIIVTTLTACRVDEHNYYKVTKIVDGDTIWIADGTPKGMKIRLIGMDAPETRKSPHKDIGCYGEEAKWYLTDLLKGPRGKEVRYVLDKAPKDRYGRTLAYIYLRDGTFINGDMVKNGYAVVATFPPNVKYEKYLRRLQEDAMVHRRGLWQSCR
jgi:micrococcal nuclease